ncbi:MAG: hypothetical protein ACRBEE_04540 [Arenicella sp.]
MKTIFVLLMALFLSSCASYYVVPEKASSTLVVLPASGNKGYQGTSIHIHVDGKFVAERRKAKDAYSGLTYTGTFALATTSVIAGDHELKFHITTYIDGAAKFKSLVMPINVKPNSEYFIKLVLPNELPKNRTDDITAQFVVEENKTGSLIHDQRITLANNTLRSSAGANAQKDISDSIIQGVILSPSL